MDGIGEIWAANYGTNGKPDGIGEVWIANASAITGGGGSGTSLTGDAQGAVDTVTTNSGKWNGVYDTVQTNSGSWTGGGGSIPTAFSAEDISANKFVGIGGVTYESSSVLTSARIIHTDDIDCEVKWYNQDAPATAWNDPDATFTGFFGWRLSDKRNYVSSFFNLIGGEGEEHGETYPIYLDIPTGTVINMTANTYDGNSVPREIVESIPVTGVVYEENGELRCGIESATFAFVQSVNRQPEINLLVDTSSYGDLTSAGYIYNVYGVVSSVPVPVVDPDGASFIAESGYVSASDFIALSNGISLSSIGPKINDISGSIYYTNERLGNLEWTVEEFSSRSLTGIQKREASEHSPDFGYSTAFETRADNSTLDAGLFIKYEGTDVSSITFSSLKSDIDYVSANAGGGSTGEYIPVANSGITAYGDLVREVPAIPGNISATEYTASITPNTRYNRYNARYTATNYWSPDEKFDLNVDFIKQYTEQGSGVYVEMYDNGSMKAISYYVPPQSIDYLSSVTFNEVSSIPGTEDQSWSEPPTDYKIFVVGINNSQSIEVPDMSISSISGEPGRDAETIFTVNSACASAKDFVANGVSLSSMIPMQVVDNASQATGSNIVYIVTGAPTPTDPIFKFGKEFEYGSNAVDYISASQEVTATLYSYRDDYPLSVTANGIQLLNWEPVYGETTYWTASLTIPANTAISVLYDKNNVSPASSFLIDISGVTYEPSEDNFSAANNMVFTGTFEEFDSISVGKDGSLIWNADSSPFSITATKGSNPITQYHWTPNGTPESNASLNVWAYEE